MFENARRFDDLEHFSQGRNGFAHPPEHPNYRRKLPPVWGALLLAGAFLTAAASAVTFSGCRGGDRTRPRPDVALIVIDTLRADYLGAYGHGAPTSPTIDGLAASALVYENAVATAPFTMPSMAALMTGRYGDRVGVHNHSAKDRLHETAATLAEAAAAAGYRTGAVVSNPWLARKDSGFEQGFDSFRTRRDIEPFAGRLTADVVVDTALELLDDADDRPVLMWVHFIDSHMPYTPPASLAKLFGNPSASSRVIEDFRKPGADRQAIYFSPDYEDRELQDTRRLYAAAVRWVDSAIGRLLAGWDRRRARPRITVILSDHGESLGDHGLYFAHDFTLFEELVHVPLIIHGTSNPPARLKTQVSVLDVMPTLCRILGLTCPRELDGAALPMTDAAGESRTIFAAGPPRRARYDRDPFTELPGLEGRATMARRGDAKLIHLPGNGADRWLAFDLSRDPQEVNGVHSPSQYADLQRELLDWRRTMLAQAARGSAKPDGTGPGRLEAETREALRELGYLD